MEAPANREPQETWAKRAGLSERTLTRVMTRETGMSFGRSIQQVAADLGYESVPRFVTMFRKVLGASPGRDMAERQSGRR
jgi:AraC-like DNA-binding protein